MSERRRGRTRAIPGLRDTVIGQAPAPGEGTFNRPDAGGAVVWQHILQALWLFLPAYVANMSPVFTAKLLPWWKAPIDGGRVHKDGRRVLGDGKTWRGLVGGGVTGGLTAVAMGAGAAGVFAGWDFGMRGYCDRPIGDLSACDAISIPWYSVFLFGFTVGFAALVGDAVESYFKRRRGKERGAPWFPFDQLDFVVFGLLGFLLGAPFLASDFAIVALTDHWLILTTILVGTPALHLLVNRIGYWLRLKEVPW